jgi:glycerol-3-phosphate dehydrogenase
LLKKYGSNAVNVCKLTTDRPELKERLHVNYPYLKAEVVYTVLTEMAVTPRDFLARRIRLEITDWETTKAILPVVADLMAQELNWADVQKQQEVASYLNIIDDFMSVAGK